MCGRFTLTATPEEVAEVLGLATVEDFPPRYNIAPTQPILLAVTGPSGKREGVLVRWGLVPSWVKDPAAFTLLINARAETAAQKPSFRNAMRHRRALIPASGFYEWRRPVDAAGKKGKGEPFFIRPRGGGIVAFGALMETWSGKDGSEIDTGAILTTAANAMIAPIHDRMPVVIPPAHFERWLDCLHVAPGEVTDLLAPGSEDLFEAIPISDRVNRVANSGPDVQLPVGPPLATQPAAPKPEKADDDQLKLI